MYLNKLPDGSDAPKYEVTAMSCSGEEATMTLTEWWCDHKQVCSIEESARDAFYSYFDKESFKILSIRRIS